MARFARIDLQIRANRLILANRFRVPELNPLLKIANRRFEAIRANRSHAMIFFFFCESIRGNRPDLRCESPGHLRSPPFFFSKLGGKRRWASQRLL